MKQVISYRIDEETLKKIKAKDTVTHFLDEAIKYRLKWLEGQEKQKRSEIYWDKNIQRVIDEAIKQFKEEN